MNLLSKITCPEYGASREELMQNDRCLVAYMCTTCGAVIKPKFGDCCVFCSYGSSVCPHMQLDVSSSVCVALNKKI
jgi:hypothetical protein